MTKMTAVMKTISTLTLVLVLLALLYTGCKPKDHHATMIAEEYVLTEPSDVVMYQINPRVFAPSNSLQAITARLDTIQDLGVNVLWIL